MVLKRCLLLILAIIGWMIPAGVLSYSVCEPSAILGVPPSLQEKPQETEGEKPTEVKLSLPFLIPGTTLIAEYLTVYDGPYLEDGSNREVVNIPVLQVCNAGTATILKAGIELFVGDECLAFCGEWIPPGASVALLECGNNLSAQKQISPCHGWQDTVMQGCLSEETLSVSNWGRGTLAITNRTAEPLRNIQIVYKGWLSSPGIYVGGIAYVFPVAELKAGETIYIDPERYVCGYSKVVCVVMDP